MSYHHHYNGHYHHHAYYSRGWRFGPFMLLIPIAIIVAAGIGLAMFLAVVGMIIGLVAAAAAILIPTAIVALLISAPFMLIARRRRKSAQKQFKKLTAEEILRERYASGAIDFDTFESQLDKIMKSRNTIQ